MRINDEWVEFTVPLHLFVGAEAVGNSLLWPGRIDLLEQERCQVIQRPPIIRGAVQQLDKGIVCLGSFRDRLDPGVDIGGSPQE